MPFDDTLAERIRECLACRRGVEEKVLFGCACHNVAMGPQNVISADFAGQAQAYIQQAVSNLGPAASSVTAPATAPAARPPTMTLKGVTYSLQPDGTYK